MAKVTLHPPFKGIRGQLGGLVFRLYPNGETIVSKYPDMSNVTWSPAQEEHRQRFKRAIAYAKAAMTDPDVRAVYEKRTAEKDNRPFQMAVSDYFKGIDLLSEKKRAEQVASPPCDVLQSTRDQNPLPSVILPSHA
jgi:hypothetical protein